MRTWLKLTVLSALFVLVLGVGVAGAGLDEVTPTTGGYPVTTTSIDPNAAAGAATQGTGLPRTGSSSSVPTAAIAGGMVVLGSALAIVARRRSAARRPLS